jgi:23S rRNA (uracil1939-C5)-methyltransferase
MLTPGELLEVKVDQPAHGGSMIARHAGEVLFVRGVIPGERVRVRIEPRTRGVTHATVVEILEPHPARRGGTPDLACGGESYRHIAYDHQLALKAELICDGFARIGGLSLPGPPAIVPSPETGYRMRGRLHVSGARIGFYRDRSHDMCDPASTGQLQPETVDVLRRLGEAFGTRQVTGIATIEFSENLPATHRALHLSPEASRSISPALVAELSQIDGVGGLSVGGRCETRDRVVHGTPFVWDRLSEIASGAAAAEGSHPLVRHVRSFFQSNRHLLRPLVDDVLARVGETPVVDLYAGVGLFACALAACGRRPITAVEGDACSARDLTRNAAPFRGQVTVARCPVETYLAGDRSGARPGTVIVDPPRTGLSKEAVRSLAVWRAPRLVYVSCDVSTLARDARRLVEAGYDPAEVRGFDLFPNTPHVETVVTFVRVTSAV